MEIGGYGEMIQGEEEREHECEKYIEERARSWERGAR